MVRKLSLVALVASVVLCAGVAVAEPPYLTQAKFDAFCRAYFTAAAEPEMFKTFGDELKVAKDGSWMHVSQNSACIAWETNIPAKTYVLYGLVSNGYGYVTPLTDRGHFIQVHYLKNLLPNTTYYYRLVMIDDLGRALLTDEMSFSTKTPAKAVAVPGILQGPPYLLDKANTTYLLTRDIAADATAINITADGVTLDLGGFKVTYNSKAGVADPGNNEAFYGPQGSQGPCGIRTAEGLKNVRIVNGFVEQGAAMGASRYNGFFPVFLRKPIDLELAGVTVTYSGGQVTGIKVNNGGDGLNLHHNVVYDQGTVLFNRHLGVNGFEVDTSKAAVNPTKVHHNLVARTRHCGIAASEKQEIFNNEIYIDSFATNSFGVRYSALKAASNLSIHHNRIFGTGFHPIGIGDGKEWSDVAVFANYVQMQGTTFEWRWRGGEGGGDADAADQSGTFPCNGIRLDKPRANVAHYENVIVVKGFGLNCMLRGLWLMPDSGAPSSVIFKNNRIRAIAQDGLTSCSAVVAGGYKLQAAHPHVSLEGNFIESNVTNIQIGDHQGHGGPYTFAGNTLSRWGADPRYRTVRIGWRGASWESFGHEFIDTTLVNGAGFDKVSFDGAPGKKYDFTVAWKLAVQTDPGTKVTIKNNAQKVVAGGDADAKGRFEATVVGVTCEADGRKDQTPHTVIVEKGRVKAEKEVTVDRSQTIAIGI